MTDTAEDRQVRPFSDLVRELRRGLTHDELSEQLADLVDAVEETRKKGKLVLTIAVEPLPKSDALVVKDSIKTTLPTPERDITVMFADDGRLTRDNPRQPAIPGIRAVDGGRTDDPQDDEQEAAR